MPPPRLGRSVLALVALVRAGGAAPSLMWEEDIGPAGTLCSNATGRCHSFAHFVFLATPSDATHVLEGGAQFSLDGGVSWRDGGAAVFESHLVAGTCEYCAGPEASCNCTSLAPSQMFSWGWEASAALEGAAPPASLCARPWLVDLAEGPGASRATLAARCVSLGAPVALGAPNTNGSVLTRFNAWSSAATRYCSPAGGRCRTNVHAVFTAATATPTEPPRAGGELSFDGGASWSSKGAFAFYEQHVDWDAATGMWWASLQFDYDALDAAPSAQSEACFRVWVLDTVTTLTVWLTEKTCLHICENLTYFHDPQGYCA